MRGGATVRRVKITYSPTPSQIGKERDLSDDEAATLVREGRAQYVDRGDGGEAEAKPARGRNRGGDPLPEPAAG